MLLHVIRTWTLQCRLKVPISTNRKQLLRWMVDEQDRCTVGLDWYIGPAPGPGPGVIGRGLAGRVDLGRDRSRPRSYQSVF